MALCRTVSEIKVDICYNFPTPLYLTHPLRGFPLEFFFTAVELEKVE